MPDAHQTAPVSAYSYRDPSGFVFEKNGVFYRQVNQVFAEDFEEFISSGCYERLVKEGLLLPHKKIPENLSGRPEWHSTLQLQTIPFVSYPYEWSFDMLRDTALGTLRLMREAIGYGMILKDATPYNWQWYRGRLIFIDTLSFSRYIETEPWIAYRQFCESFLAPLLLMHYRKESLQQLFMAYPEGIPLPVASKLLPWRTGFSLHVYLHVHLHARIAARQKSAKEKTYAFSRRKLLNLLSSLQKLIEGLRLSDRPTGWSGYFEEAGQREDYLQRKKELVSSWVAELPQLNSALDLGANEGEFAQLLAEKNLHTVAADQDAFCVNRLYRKLRSSAGENIQPLVLDLANPSPALGVANRERASFLRRAQSDLVLALGLVHHLAVGRNIPLPLVAEMFSGLADYLIIEFIPTGDEKLREMLAQKNGVTHPYDESLFESSFRAEFELLKKESIGGSGRILYLMKRHAKTAS